MKKKSAIMSNYLCDLPWGYGILLILIIVCCFLGGCNMLSGLGQDIHEVSDWTLEGLKSGFARDN